MRVLVCGSRYFQDKYPDLDGAKELLYEVLHEINGTYDSRSNIKEIIHGGARGADVLSGEFGRDFKIPVRVYPALWELYGKSAGPIRNKQMLEEGQPDLVVAFLAKDSIGTANMLELATRAGIETKIIDI